MNSRLTLAFWYIVIHNIFYVCHIECDPSSQSHFSQYPVNKILTKYLVEMARYKIGSQVTKLSTCRVCGMTSPADKGCEESLRYHFILSSHFKLWFQLCSVRGFKSSIFVNPFPHRANLQQTTSKMIYKNVKNLYKNSTMIIV